MSDQEIQDRVEGDPEPDSEPDPGPDAKALVGAPARELKADLAALLRDARALLADVDALDTRIKAAVAAAPSLDGPSGSARLMTLTGAGVTVLDDIDRRARLTGSDPELVGWARSIAGWVPSYLDPIGKAGIGWTLMLRGAQVRASIDAALIGGWRLRHGAQAADVPRRFAAAAAARARVAADARLSTEATQPTGAHVGWLREITGLVADDADRPLLDAAVVRQLAEVGALAQGLVGQERAGRRQVQRSFDAIREGAVERSLSEVPLDRLRDASSVAGLRLTAIEGAGYRTVADVLRAGPEVLDLIPGVGRVTADQVYAAARQVADVAAADVNPRLDPDTRDGATTELVRALRDWSRVGGPLRWLRGDLERAGQELGELADQPLPESGLLIPVRAADAAPAGVGQRIDGWAQWWRARHTEVVRAQEEIERANRAQPTPPPSPEQDGERAWSDFLARPSDYYAWLAEVTGFGVKPDAERGDLPEEIVAAIRDFRLDLSLVTASVRGYQEFGAKFALVQRHTLLGDEMGLGKTVQAIAAMAHLTATGERHFLVVCPAAVLVNWLREIARHSRLTAYRLHGEDRYAALADWRARGGVGVTTFGQLDTLELPEDLALGMLVADEAHYLKNPQSQRSRAVQALLPRSTRAMLLSGTPLENRLEEFATLVGYLQPQVLAALDPAAAVVKASAFRQAVAPVYLRRNQEDVLTELPELVESEEWVELTSSDRSRYAVAVAAGNFMAMRKAALSEANPQECAKLDRLLDLVQEAVDNGRRVVVFSFFRDVLDLVTGALRSSLGGAPVFGPVTGSLPSEARQLLIDDFTSHERAGVLVSQIEAGGVGTNIQAASVVVLCEPQVKPSAETQAIARVHRMGQVRSVQVHRLLGDDSVDERLLEILAGKTAVFDTYVRESAMGDSAPEAVDISERNLAARIIAAEQERLRVGPQDIAATAGSPQDSPTAPGTPQDASTIPEAPQDAR